MSVPTAYKSHGRERPDVEHVKQECWDNDGKPYLRMYTGSGRLRGKYALITGAANGVGRATATIFAIEGLKGLTISHLPQEMDDAKAAAADVAMFGCEVNLVALDLRHDADCQRLVASHTEKFGHLNVLVNNPSKQTIEQKIEHLDLDNVRRTFESNIVQMIAVTKFAVPHMKRGSSIINTTSAAAYAGSPGRVDYSAAQGAIMSFTRSLSKQLAPRGIRVNVVALGPVVTALHPASSDAEDMEGFRMGMPMHGRAAQPAELAPAFVFLASPDSNMMTGACMHVNNGMHTGSP